LFWPLWLRREHIEHVISIGLDLATAYASP